MMKTKLTVAAHLLHEMGVVTHDQHRRVGQSGEVFHEPPHRLGVEVVRRLVEQ